MGFNSGLKGLMKTGQEEQGSKQPWLKFGFSNSFVL
jgi:hypothetical protein